MEPFNTLPEPFNMLLEPSRACEKLSRGFIDFSMALLKLYRAF
jgi:hypothetical protein